MNPTTLLRNAYQRSLASINGAELTAQWLQHHAIETPVYLLAIGKAAPAMARGAAFVLQQQIQSACVVTSHTNLSACPFDVIRSSHPVLDQSSVVAGQQVLKFIQHLPERAHLLVLLSGGASSLVEVLPDGVTLADYQNVIRYLLSNAFDIHQINAVRKRLSKIKGGQLLRACPASVTVTPLLISDVPGNRLSSIGSGPFVVHHDSIPEPLPSWITALMQAQTCEGVIPAITHHLLASNEIWLAQFAAQFNQPAAFLPRLSGDVGAWANQCAQYLRDKPSGLFLAGGECTVTLPSTPGQGGRLQQLVLALLQSLPEQALTVLAASSDGCDGSSDAAGVLLSQQQWLQCLRQKASARQAYNNANSYAFWQRYGGHLFCSATETNVMDLVAIIKE